jgi:hypothetical protein
MIFSMDLDEFHSLSCVSSLAILNGASESMVSLDVVGTEVHSNICVITLFLVTRPHFRVSFRYLFVDVGRLVPFLDQYL